MHFLLWQTPFNPKDWTVLPASIIALAFLVWIGVWAAERLGLVKKSDSPVPSPPPIQHTNGATKEVLETKLQSLREILQRDFAEHERRITRHKEEILKLWDTFDARLSAQNRRLEEIEKWRNSQQ